MTETKNNPIQRIIDKREQLTIQRRALGETLNQIAEQIESDSAALQQLQVKHLLNPDTAISKKIGTLEKAIKALDEKELATEKSLDILKLGIDQLTATIQADKRREAKALLARKQELIIELNTDKATLESQLQNSLARLMILHALESGTPSMMIDSAMFANRLQIIHTDRMKPLVQTELDQFRAHHDLRGAI